MKKITDEIQSVVLENEKIFIDDTIVKSYENAIREYNVLLEQGLITKRGNQLMDIEDRFSTKQVYNI